MLHDLLERITAAHAINSTHRTKSGRPSKVRASVNQVIKESLSHICPEDAETHQIKLKQLTFTILTCYPQTFLKRVKRLADAVVLEAEVTADQDGTAKEEEVATTCLFVWDLGLMSLIVCH